MLNLELYRYLSNLTQQEFSCTGKLVTSIAEIKVKQVLDTYIMLHIKRINSFYKNKFSKNLKTFFKKIMKEL